MSRQLRLIQENLNKNECLAYITHPLSTETGFRHLWIGYSGSGKTFANAELTDTAADSHKYVIVTDQKERYSPYTCIPQVPGIGALNAIESDKRGRKEALIRGLRMTGDIGDVIDFDAVGKKVWELSLENGGVLLSIDELSDACQGERVWLKGDAKRSYMRLLYTQGRANKISICACTQHVQEIPRSAISNSDTLGIFRQDRKELPYYAASNFLDDEELDIVSSLDDYEFLFIKRGYKSAVCRF